MKFFAELEVSGQKEQPALASGAERAGGGGGEAGEAGLRGLKHVPPRHQQAPAPRQGIGRGGAQDDGQLYVRTPQIMGAFKSKI